MKTSLTKLALLVATGSMVVATGVEAGGSPQTTTIAVSATVTDNCIITSTTPIALGNFDPTTQSVSAGNGEAQGSVTLRCTKNAPVTLKTDDGIGTGKSSSESFLDDASTDQVAYQLYTDSAYTNLINSSVGYSFTGGGATPTVINLYAKVNPTDSTTENAPAGSYSDTVTITATFT